MGFERLRRRIDPATGGVDSAIDAIPTAEGGANRLIGRIAEGGRGAECAEPVVFGGRPLAFDDRTGPVREVRAGLSPSRAPSSSPAA